MGCAKGETKLLPLRHTPSANRQGPAMSRGWMQRLIIRASPSHRRSRSQPPSRLLAASLPPGAFWEDRWLRTESPAPTSLVGGLAAAGSVCADDSKILSASAVSRESVRASSRRSCVIWLSFGCAEAEDESQ